MSPIHLPVVVPAVTTCSILCRSSLVVMPTSTPLSNAANRPSIAGWDVRLGVWIVILCLAERKARRRKVFRGVGGGGGGDWKGRGWKFGLRWWGEGRKRVGVCWCWCWVGRERCVKRAEDGEGEGIVAVTDSSKPALAGSPSRSSTPFQNSSQNFTNCCTTSPLNSTHPSSHSSQLTLQLGKKAHFRSTTTNFGWIMLMGSKKTLLTCRSMPCSSSGVGRPRVLLHSAGE